MLAILNIRSPVDGWYMTLKCMFGIWWFYQAFYLTSLPKLFGSFHDRLAQAAWISKAWWISGIMEMVWIVPWNLTLTICFLLTFPTDKHSTEFLAVGSWCVQAIKALHTMLEIFSTELTDRYFILLTLLELLFVVQVGWHAGFSRSRCILSSEGLEGS